MLLVAVGGLRVREATGVLRFEEDISLLLVQHFRGEVHCWLDLS
jgi:hypothetical protein